MAQSRAPLDPRLTEQRNPATAEIDLASPLRIVELMSAEDRKVADAVYGCRREIAAAIELVEHAFRSGGRLIYVGAGTSGRLGVLDAAECPPTFGTDPELVQGIIAGGLQALVRPEEGAEDEFDAGASAVDGRDVGGHDVVFGIAASGSTPFVRGAVTRAAARGAKTVLARAQGSYVEHRARRDGRPHGRVRLGQDHADEHPRLPRPAELRPLLVRRPGGLGPLHR